MSLLITIVVVKLTKITPQFADLHKHQLRKRTHAPVKTHKVKHFLGSRHLKTPTEVPIGSESVIDSGWVH